MRTERLSPTPTPLDGEGTGITHGLPAGEGQTSHAAMESRVIGGQAFCGVQEAGKHRKPVPPKRRGC